MEGVVIAKVGKKISTVAIDSVQAEHAGEYSCIAKNKAGVAQFTSRLNVNGIFIF